VTVTALAGSEDVWGTCGLGLPEQAAKITQNPAANVLRIMQGAPHRVEETQQVVIALM
jgi:hypothetical protein